MMETLTLMHCMSFVTVVAMLCVTCVMILLVQVWHTQKVLFCQQLSDFLRQVKRRHIQWPLLKIFSKLRFGNGKVERMNKIHVKPRHFQALWKMKDVSLLLFIMLRFSIYLLIRETQFKLLVLPQPITLAMHQSYGILDGPATTHFVTTI